MAFEGGEVGEGAVYEPQGAATWSLDAIRKLGSQSCNFRRGCVYLADIHYVSL